MISIKPHKYSLLKTFVIHSAIILTVFSTYSVWSCLKIYNIEREKIIDTLQVHSERMSRALMDSMDYTEHMMNYMAKQIVVDSDKGKDKKYIYELLKSFKFDMTLGKLLSWSTFMWANDQFKIEVDGTRGILKEPVDLSKRDYIPYTVSQPWKLHIGQPVFGAMSELWVLPAGLGGVNKNGKYQGSVVTGIKVDGVKALLQNAVTDPKISFMMLDSNYVQLASSTSSDPENIDKEFIKKIDALQNRDASIITESSVFSDDEYTYFNKVPKHGFIIVTSYDKATSDKMIWSAIAVQVIENLILSLGFVIALGFLYYRIIRPIKQLAQQTEKITKSVNSTKVSSSSIKEIDTLATQIANVRDLKNQLYNAKEIAEAATRGKSEFLASTAHELRSPLNAIIGMSEVIKTKVFGENINSYLEYAGDIEYSGHELLEFITDLIDNSKAESGNFALDNEEWIDIENIIHRAKKLNINTANKAHIRIDVHVQENLPKLFADGRRLRQVLVNLISNSIKYSPADTVINITALINDGKMTLLVVDQGFGMNEDQLSVALTKWGMVKNKNSGKMDSSGLGLPLAKYLVELHGAEFTIESMPGEGTTITMVFPQERVQ